MITPAKVNYSKRSNNEDLFRSKFKKQINLDILRCEEAEIGEREKIADELINKYVMFYSDFGKDLENSSDKLTAVKNRLEVIVTQRIAPKLSSKVPTVDIKPTFYNTNVVDVNVSFEEVRQKIDDMDNVSEQEYNEIIQKLNQLEEIISSSESKRKKWVNASEILKWLADKSVDVGIALLPLFLNIK